MSLLKKRFFENRGITLEAGGWRLEAGKKFYARNFLHPASRAIHHFKNSCLHRIFADHDTLRDAKEVALGELLTRSRISVVIENFNAGFRHIRIESVCCFRDFVAVFTKRNNMYCKRLAALRPNKTILVGEYFNDSSHEPRGAYAITAHYDRIFLALFI